MLVDTHCHLDLITDDPQELTQILSRAKDNHVTHILNVCVAISDFDQVRTIAESYPDISASVGLHPNEIEENVTADTLLELGNHPKVVAIGETGLDYYRSSGDLAWQRDRFRMHINVAKRLQKPLIIHTRAAKEDTLQIMREEKAHEAGGIMHCFSEDWSIAKQALDMGFYISFSGIVTFKNSQILQSVAQQVPLDRLLVETDAPYLAPQPHRGKQNEPAFVYHTALFIANLRGIPFEELAAQTTHNFFNLCDTIKKPYD